MPWVNPTSSMLSEWSWPGMFFGFLCICNRNKRGFSALQKEKNKKPRKEECGAETLYGLQSL
jgi:hypothetical protein